MNTRGEQLAAIREYGLHHARSVLFEEADASLMDTFSVKSVPLRIDHLITVEARTNRETKLPYLVLLYDDGPQLALSDAGIAFPPDPRNTGPLPELPEVACFRDFRALLDQLKHELYGHAEEAPTRRTLTLLLMCIAILDGARAAHFDVGKEEREVEVHLAELEKRAPPKTP